MLRTLIVAAAGLLALLPFSADAQQLTPDQVRLQFAEQGYVVDAPTAWTDGVAMLGIHASSGEQPGWPVMRAFVFSTAAEPSPAQLLSGYSTPTWQDNVAIVGYDPTAFPPEPDCAPTAVEIR